MSAALAEQDPITAGLYTPADVARYLRAPLWLVLARWRGPFRPFPEAFFPWLERWPYFPHGLEDGEAVFPLLRERCSFARFSELYLLHFAAQSLLERLREEPPRDGRTRHLSEVAWNFFRDDPSDDVTWADRTSPEGLARLLRVVGEHLGEEEKSWLEKRLHLCLGRFDVDTAVPVRLYPFTRSPAESSPRAVVLDPAVRFGRPTLAGHGIPTDILIERFRAGDSLAELAADYKVDAASIEEAIRYESSPSPAGLPLLDW